MTIAVPSSDGKQPPSSTTAETAPSADSGPQYFIAVCYAYSESFVRTPPIPPKLFTTSWIKKPDETEAPAR